MLIDHGLEKAVIIQAREEIMRFNCRNCIRTIQRYLLSGRITFYEPFKETQEKMYLFAAMFICIINELISK